MTVKEHEETGNVGMDGDLDNFCRKSGYEVYYPMENGIKFDDHKNKKHYPNDENTHAHVSMSNNSSFNTAENNEKKCQSNPAYEEFQNGTQSKENSTTVSNTPVHKNENKPEHDYGYEVYHSDLLKKQMVHIDKFENEEELYFKENQRKKSNDLSNDSNRSETNVIRPRNESNHDLEAGENASKLGNNGYEVYYPEMLGN